jgi:hypothetical protein
VKVPELTSIGRRGPELPGTWQRVDARPAPYLGLKLVCRGTRSAGYRHPQPHSILPPLLALLPLGTAAPFFYCCCRWASPSPAAATAAGAFHYSRRLDAAIGAFPFPYSRRRLDSTARAFPFPCSRCRRLHSVALLHFTRRRPVAPYRLSVT